MNSPITSPSTKIEMPGAPKKAKQLPIEREKSSVCRVLFPDEY